MRFDWTRLSIFGVLFSIPIIRLIIRKSEEQITAFGQHRAELSQCDKCHRLFNHRAGVRLIMHLQNEHEISEDKSIQIVDDLYRRLLILNARSKAVAGD